MFCINKMNSFNGLLLKMEYSFQGEIGLQYPMYLLSMSCNIRSLWLHGLEIIDSVHWYSTRINYTGIYIL